MIFEALCEAMDALLSLRCGLKVRLDFLDHTSGTALPTNFFFSPIFRPSYLANRVAHIDHARSDSVNPLRSSI
jgi:hypothetical protein